MSHIRKDTLFIQSYSLKNTEITTKCKTLCLIFHERSAKSWGNPTLQEGSTATADLGSTADYSLHFLDSLTVQLLRPTAS